MSIKQWSVLVAALSTSSVALATTTDIVVTGVIKPGACTPSLSGGGVFDFGVISPEQLSLSNRTQFRSPPQQLSVNCDAPTRFVLRAVDNRAGTANWPEGSATAFGLGLHDGQRIGTYFLQTIGNSYVVDGNSSVRRLITADIGLTWQPDSNGSFSHLYNGTEGRFHGFAVGADVPTAMRQLSADLRIDMRVAPLAELSVADDITIDGASTLEVTYL
jgi:type 1 fimbria pilin